MKKLYLKKVCLLLSHGKWLVPFVDLLKKLPMLGIECEALLIDEEFTKTAETLYVTDQSKVAAMLTEAGLPVLVYCHEENRQENFSAARYVMEQPQELEPKYLERVYRRFVGLPWEILETERCILRESIVEDAEALADIYGEADVTRYMDEEIRYKICERDYIQEYIENIYAFFEFGLWTVIEKESGRVIGHAGLSVREGFELPELGYVIGIPWQGKGLAKEVCEGILKYAREELDFDKIQLLVQKENDRSLNLAKRLGFVYERSVIIEGKTYLFLVKIYT